MHTQMLGYAKLIPLLLIIIFFLPEKKDESPSLINVSEHQI